MVSPELLRRYPFFAHLGEAQLQAIAMLAQEITVETGTTILEENNPADAFYLLLEGNIDLYYTVKESYKPELQKEVVVGEVNPGEPFGISALIEPYRFTSTARTSADSRVIGIDAQALRELLEKDQSLAYQIFKKIARAAMERLSATRVQLAAAYA